MGSMTRPVTAGWRGRPGTPASPPGGGLRPARAALRAAHVTTPPAKGHPHLGVTPKSEGSTPGLERRLQPARAALRAAHVTTPPGKGDPHLGATLRAAHGKALSSTILLFSVWNPD